VGFEENWKKDEDWALFEAVWLRNEKDMKIWRFGEGLHHHTKVRNEGSVENTEIYSQGCFVIDYREW